MGRSLVVLAALALPFGGCGEPERAPAARASEVVDRLTRGGEALYAHARVTEGGEVTLRTLAGGERTWRLVERLEDPSRRLPSGRADARLIVEADALAPWGRVLRVLQVAAGPRVRMLRVTFLAPDDAGAIDVSLPFLAMGGTPGVTSVPARVLTVECARETPGTPSAPFTRLRIAGRDAWIEDADADLQEEPVVKEAPAPEGVTIDLVGDVTEAWRRAEDLLQGEVAGSRIVRGEVVASPPNGGRVPYGDVIRVLRALRRTGASRVHFL